MFKVKSRDYIIKLQIKVENFLALNYANIECEVNMIENFNKVLFMVFKNQEKLEENMSIIVYL